MGETPALKTEKLTKVYVMGKIHVAALQDVDITVEQGRFLGVAGPSGSGKSTLMNLLGGLDTPTSGTIQTHGKLISGMGKQELALYRRLGVGMIFQSFNLIPSFTALENVALPLVFAGVGKTLRQRRAAEALNQVGLSARQAHRPAELSGGEQQRVAIARALVNRPRVLLADEPTGNLDSLTSLEIVRALAELNRTQRLTVVMVSHETALLQEYAHQIIYLFDGRIKTKENIR